MFEAVAAFIRTNPVIAGAGGVTAAGYLAAYAKELPKHLWSMLTEQVMTELTVWSEDRVFDAFDLWFSQHASTKNMRRLAITEQWEQNAENHVNVALTPGPGQHILWHHSRPFFITRSVADQASFGESLDGPRRRRRQSLKISTFGRSQKPIRALMDDVRSLTDGHDKIRVSLWEGFGTGTRLDVRNKRAMDTVYCDEALKSFLIADIQKFVRSHTDYISRGIPYRRSYLFEGPPGTGKTTMIFALASLIERPVLIVQAAAIANDRELILAMNAGSDHIIVVEEIDALRASETRETAEPPDQKGDVAKTGITLAGLLEAMDGISARDGRILFLTTNRPEKLDGALLRPGRIDVRKFFNPATLDEALAMFERFYPERDSTSFRREMEHELPLPHAEIQNRLLAQFG